MLKQVRHISFTVDAEEIEPGTISNLK